MPCVNVNPFLLQIDVWNSYSAEHQPNLHANVSVVRMTHTHTKKVVYRCFRSQQTYRRTEIRNSRRAAEPSTTRTVDQKWNQDMKVKYMISWYLEESASKEKIWTVMITNPIIKENIFDVLLFPTTLVQWNKTKVRITITWSLNKIQRIIDLALKSVGLHQHQIYNIIV